MKMYKFARFYIKDRLITKFHYPGYKNNVWKE